MAVSCDRHKADLRNGGLCRAAELTYDPSSCRPKLDNKKGAA
ncbi:hypothetical protein [Sporosarcina koreensis]|uniref:Uncharacterized protein n=1 Tax=Sporosarcina koreensis TaxID=334735 RepID=A0ABW0TV85_9BACL